MITSRTRIFVQWLRHAGVPLARPGLLLVALTGLLLTTVFYLALMLTDDTLTQTLAEHLTDAELTPEGLNAMRMGFVAQNFFAVTLLLVGWIGLAKGWRFARLIWLLLLGFAILSDLWRILLPAIPLIVSLMFDTPLSEIPREQWIPVMHNLLVGAAFFVLSALLFLPPIGRWYKALRHATNTP